MAEIGRPEPTEHAPYFARYISQVPDGDVLAVLAAQTAELRRALGAFPEAKERYRYAEGKWSIREVLGHVTDTERVFGYRALCVARGDATPLPGFDENVFGRNAPHDAFPLADLLDEFDAVRQGHLLFFRHLPQEAWTRLGTANNLPVSPRALAYNMAGHVIHHLTGLRDNYGVPLR
ncbi:MAG TPA: DinB family protein [Thermoanaerobaculia bacterium]|nr:DinB family protein [Thermoanaerobaculia bacterium]